MPVKRKPCIRCGKNRALKFYTARGNVCSTCRRGTARRAARSTHLQQTYGIELAHYNALLEYQNHACAICLGKRSGSYDVDHDHKKEKALIADGADPLTARRDSIRGLLCRRCNRRLLPATLDDLRIMQGAIDYLLNPPARHVLGG